MQSYIIERDILSLIHDYTKLNELLVFLFKYTFYIYNPLYERVVFNEYSKTCLTRTPAVPNILSAL